MLQRVACGRQLVPSAGSVQLPAVVGAFILTGEGGIMLF